METIKSKMVLYVKRFMKSYHIDQMQMAIIFSFLLIATLASLWLPAYFVGLALQVR